jgi:fumarate hydratase class II
MSNTRPPFESRESEPSFEGGRDLVDEASWESFPASDAPSFTPRVGTARPGFRLERDALGAVEVQNDRYWGAQTERARSNFRIGSERVPEPLLRAFGLQKKAAALANLELGALDRRIALGIVTAAEELATGRHLEHFPLRVWQSGSGTQTHMNVNEVLAARANELLGCPIGRKGLVHPNDHVNLGQSTNDSFPTALHVAAVRELRGALMPALRHLHDALAARSVKFQDVVKLGRTHLQDAVPMTLGQELSGWAQQVENACARISASLDRLRELPQGGTAVGTGINAPRGFREAFARHLSVLVGVPFRPAPNAFEAISARDAVVEASAALAVIAGSLTKIAGDVRILASGPRGGISELRLPENEPGSSIMPGKVNPTQAEMLTMVCAQVIGNHAAITAATLGPSLQLQTCQPLLALDLLQSIALLSDASRSFADRCIAGLEPNLDAIRSHVERSLMLVTAPSPVIGYEKAAKAHGDGTTLREAALTLGYLSEEQLDEPLRPETMT